MTFAQPSSVGSSSSNARRSTGAAATGRGTPTANATMPSTRSGSLGREHGPRARRRRRTARRGPRVAVPVASITGSMSLDDPLVRVGGGVGRPVRAAVAAPVERDDAVVPAQVRGPGAFHCREWMIGAEGRSTSVGVARRRRRRTRAGRRPSAVASRSVGPASPPRRRSAERRRRRSRSIASPVPRRRDEVADAAGCTRDRVARRAAMWPPPASTTQPRPEELRQVAARPGGCRSGSSVAVDDERRAA